PTMRDMKQMRLSLSLILLSMGRVACVDDSTKPPAEPDATDRQSSAPATDPGAGTATGEEMSEEELAALAEVEAQEADAGAAPVGAEGAREVVYRMTPDGLKVEVDGAVFALTAKSYMTPEGYGVEITVEATSKIEGVLANPEGGPLAFGGRVIRKTGRVDTFGDKRSGGGTKALSPTSPQKFSRKWPIANVSLLSPGDELQLEIGLWGYGPKDGTMKPVRRFASVKMRSEEHTSELQSRENLVCRLLLEKKK